MLNLCVPDLKTEEICSCGLILMFISLTRKTSSMSLGAPYEEAAFFLSVLETRPRVCVEPKGATAYLRELLSEGASY